MLRQNVGGLLLMILTSCSGSMICAEADYKIHGLGICESTAAEVDREQIKNVMMVVAQEVGTNYSHFKDVMVIFTDKWLAIGCEDIGSGAEACDQWAWGVTTDFGNRVFVFLDGKNRACVSKSSLAHELIHVLQEKYWKDTSVMHPPDLFCGHGMPCLEQRILARLPECPAPTTP